MVRRQTYKIHQNSKGYKASFASLYAFSFYTQQALKQLKVEFVGDPQLEEDFNFDIKWFVSHRLLSQINLGPHQSVSIFDLPVVSRQPKWPQSDLLWQILYPAAGAMVQSNGLTPNS